MVEGARAIGFTLGTPGPPCSGWSTTCWSTARSSSSAGTRARARQDQRRRPPPAAPHNVANALAAAALARSFGVPAAPSATGCATSGSARHKIQTVAERDGVRFVDDSKATNPHAADAALRAYDPGRSGSPAARPRAPTSTIW